MSEETQTYEGLLRLARYLNKEGRIALAEKWARMSENYSADSEAMRKSGNIGSSERMNSFSETYKGASEIMRRIAMGKNE